MANKRRHKQIKQYKNMQKWKDLLDVPILDPKLLGKMLGKTLDECDYNTDNMTPVQKMYWRGDG